MQMSTPLSKNTGSLRKSLLMREAANSGTSQKKRLSNIINQSPILQTEVDDEFERSKRRNEADIQRRLSSISSPRSPQLSNEKEICDHFQICLKMYAENKISARNVWNLKIIDYMRTVLYSKGLAKDSLQVAGTSLDVSAKIYGIRVDDVHSEGLKIASSMARVNAQRDTEETGEGDDDLENEQEGEGDKEKGPKKKKKWRMFKGQKATIAKDPKSLLGDVQKLESVFFQTRVSLESSSIDNLFTSKLPMNHSCYKFMLLSKEMAWPSENTRDKNINFENKCPITVNPVKSLQICPAFADFIINEWDPDHEEQQLAVRPVLNEVPQDEVVYDNEGIPIPELDGSIHDMFPNEAAENHYESSEEEVEKIGHDAVLTNKVAHIIDFKPDEKGVCANDYSYSSVLNILGNKLITQVWAGPSHWKLKHIRRTISRFSGQPEKQVNKPTVKKTKVLPTLIDFRADLPPFDKTKLYKPKRSTRIDESPTKITLPQVTHFHNTVYRSLMLKPVFLRLGDNKNKDDVEDPEVQPYNYQNPNDSLYCSQNGMDNHDGLGDDGFGDRDEDDVHNREELPQNFIGNNLIDLPEQVPKTYIPYALQAKKMDMKKLKTAVWKCLVSLKPNEIILDDNMYSREVPNKKFSELYREIPGRISEKMQQELSCPLAFVALLHLANEQNLAFTSQPDLSDFLVEHVKQFVK